jgi:hypothetical protein
MTEPIDPIDLGTAARLLDPSRVRPLACCPVDGEPLVSCMEYRGAEFLCMVCGAKVGFLGPTPKDPTPELDARYAELLAAYRAGERP